MLGLAVDLDVYHLFDRAPKIPKARLIAGGRCNAHFVGVDTASKAFVTTLAFAVTRVEDIVSPGVASKHM